MSSRSVQYVVKVIEIVDGHKTAGYFDGSDIVDDIELAYHYNNREDAEEIAAEVRSDFDVVPQDVSVQEREV